ncbi:MAG: sigma-70 family RNA polymerase sigma factor [Acidimicrobiia bacterium]|jgi:RNA polymerase sigma-70 factor (ECF subfamily)|nr:sigma-70 family RNA polymerase sigma factor [Acidimicrobiia bacterium]
MGQLVTATAYPADVAVVEGLRRGSDATFGALIDRHQGSMLRVAAVYVADRNAAEDVVQETWMAVIRGIDRFDGRSSIKTWIFRILTNRAKTMGRRASRVVPISSLNGSRDGPAVDPDHFFDTRHPYWPGHWCNPPSRWAEGPEDRVATKDAVGAVLRAIAALPSAQREVVTLRDVECWTAVEVCDALDLSETNQRVLLHRARSKVRRQLEDHYEDSCGR